MRHLPYRLGVGTMLMNKDGGVFVGRRFSEPESDAWQMPQGGIDAGEDPRKAAFRELFEETGVASAEIIAETAGWLDYKLPDELVPAIWGGRYAGQRQKWYLLRFTGTDNDVNINGADPEFCAWKWERPQNLPGLIVPFKRALYDKILRAFAAHIDAS